MPDLGSPPPAPARIRVHGRLTRHFMMGAGLVLAGFGGVSATMLAAAAGSMMRRSWSGVAAAAYLAILVALGLAILFYGAFLVVRGSCGYSRPTARTDRLLAVVGTSILVGGAAALAAALRHVAGADAVRLQDLPWTTAEGAAWRASLFVLALPLQLAAHELGHLLAARAVGLELTKVPVGPLCVEQRDGRRRVAWRPLELGLGGSATVPPARTDRWRNAIFAAGGPAANVLLALAAHLAATALSPPETRAATIAVGLLGPCAFQGIALGVSSLVPAHGPETDGARIVRAIRPMRTVPAAVDRS